MRLPFRRDPGPGLFPADSVARRVMEERVVALYYGQRATLVGALEPLAFVGTTRHTYSGGGKLYDRMLRTARSFETIWHGPVAAAEAELKRVAALHATVKGRLPTDLSPQYPAGTRYSAHDPWLSYMTMAFLADSSRAIHEAFVGPLSSDERESWWQDWRRFGELYGMPADAAPATYAGFRAQYDGWLASDQPFLTPRARRAGITLLDVTLPAVLQPFNWSAYLVVVGTSEPTVRQAYGLPWNHGHRAAFAAATTASRLGRPLVPDVVAKGRLAPLGDALLPFAEARLTRRVTGRAG